VAALPASAIGRALPGANCRREWNEELGFRRSGRVYRSRRVDGADGSRARPGGNQRQDAGPLHCKLANVDYGRELYNGTCVLKETLSGQTTIFEIRMGSSESFKFATADGGKTWMHGPEQVRFRDRGHQAVFRWVTFRLEVEEE
jgi:hypothetical protein